MSADTDPAPDTGLRPYPGLRPFHQDECHLYFGREQHRRDLLKRLASTRFVAIVGTSGSGKSSLVQAGLLPDLLCGYLPGTGSDWVMVESQPKNDPIGRLAEAFGRCGWTVDPETLRTDSSAIVDLARRHLGDDQHLLVLVDQFEELFRLKISDDATRDADEKAAFVRTLLTAGHQRRDLSSHPRVHVAIALRSEFLGRTSVFRGLPEAIDQGQYLIPRLTREQLHAAIECPARVATGRVDEALAQKLLNELGDAQDQLPVLQHLLMRCWEVRDASNTIGAEAYQQSGGLAGALSTDADGALDDVRCTLSDRAAKIVERTFQALRETDVNGGQTRRPTIVGDLCAIAACTPEDLAVAMAPFRRRSFVLPPLAPDECAPGASLRTLDPSLLLDISHEALLRGWDRLRKWIEQDDVDRLRYIRIASRAVDERDSPSPDYFVPPQLPALVKFWEDRDPPRAWALRHHPEFDAAKAFLDASVAHQREIVQAEAERQRQDTQRSEELAQAVARTARMKRVFVLATGALSLTLTIIAGGVLALDEIDDRRDEAVQLRVSAVQQTERLAAALVSAGARSAGDGDLRLQLAAEGYRRRPDPLAAQWLLESLRRTSTTLDTPWAGALQPALLSAMALSADDRRLFAIEGDTVWAIEIASGRRLFAVPVADAGLLMPAGDRLLVTGTDNVYVLDGTTGRRLGETGDVSALAASADGSVAVFLMADGSVEVCLLATNCASGRRHAITDVLEAGDLAVSPDGKTLAIVGSRLALFEIEPWKLQRVVDFSGNALAIGMDDDHVVVCTPSGIRQFDKYDGTLDEGAAVSFDSVVDRCAISSAGAAVATALGRTVRVFDLDGLVSESPAGAGDLTRLALGTTVLAAIGDRVRLMDLTPFGRRSRPQRPLGYARGGRAVYDDQSVYDLEGTAVTPVPNLRLGTARPRAVSDSLNVAAHVMSIPAQRQTATRARTGAGELALAAKREVLVVEARDGAGPVLRGRFDATDLIPAIRRRGLFTVPGSDRLIIRISQDDRYVAVSGTRDDTPETVVLGPANAEVIRTLPGKARAYFAPGDLVVAVTAEGHPSAVSVGQDGPEREIPMGPLRMRATTAPAFTTGGGWMAIAGSGHAVDGRAPSPPANDAPEPTPPIVKIFEWPSLKPVGDLPLPFDATHLAFRPDGRALIVSTTAGTSIVLDLDTWTETLRIPAKTGESGASIASFTSGGAIAVLDRKGLTVLPGDPEQWRLEACRRVTRSITPQEWTDLVDRDVEYVRPCADQR